ncbi:MAG: hypothetical protein R3C53_15525 [Pirellulaceae bacterium]
MRRILVYVGEPYKGLRRDILGKFMLSGKKYVFYHAPAAFWTASPLFAALTDALQD